MSTALERWFDAYTRWLMRWGWFRMLAGAAERADDRGRVNGWW